MDFSASWRLPNLVVFQAADFRGRIPRESLSFSSEKSYSPSVLMCTHAIGEWVPILRRMFCAASEYGAFRPGGRCRGNFSRQTIMRVRDQAYSCGASRSFMQLNPMIGKYDISLTIMNYRFVITIYSVRQNQRLL
ncbi:MAG: hypothetical protein AB7V04_03920, partial [Desulfomonilaceae bacterium]